MSYSGNRKIREHHALCSVQVCIRSAFTTTLSRTVVESSAESYIFIY